MSWTEYGVRSTVVLVILTIGYILFTKISGSDEGINWETIVCLWVGHIAFLLLRELLIAMMQWLICG